MIQDYEYLIADSRNLCHIFEDQHFDKVDLILTSPPYYDVKLYDRIDSQIGYNQTYTDYLNDTVNILQQCYEVSSDNATLWIITDTIKREGNVYPIPFDINQKLHELSKRNLPKHKTWLLRDIIIWNRSKNLPWHATGRFKHEFEYILFFSKSNNYKFYLDRVRDISSYRKWWLTYPERYNPKGRPPSNIWEFSIPIRGWGNSHQNHLCPFPFPLIERIISLASDENDIVLDPFAGSGSVIAIAKYMGRRGIGIDVNRKYREQYQNEVVIGAQRYWDKRKSELVKTQNKINLFEDVNIKLRKIKAGIKLAKLVTSPIKDNKLAAIIVDDQQQHDGIELALLVDQPEQYFELSSIEREIDKLQSKFKIHISLYYVDYETAKARFLNKLFFVYSEKKIYSYYQCIPFSDITLDSRCLEHVYSDIEIDTDIDSFI